GGTDRHRCHLSLEPLQEFVVEPLVDDRARARRALLTLKAERPRIDALHAGFQVRVLVEDREILSPHFEDRALDPDLPLPHLGRALSDPDPDLLGAGERHESDARMLYERIPDASPRAGKKIENTGGDPRLLQNLE